MRKLIAGALALCAVLAVGTLADAATKKKPKKVETRAGIAYAPGVDDPYDPYDQAYSKATFSGKVKVDAQGKAKKKCLKGRTVKIRGIGRDRTNRRGRYSISAGSADAPPRNYRAVVKTKQRGKKLVCKRGRSGRITVS
jgi:uncharacterized membrane protein